MKFKEVCSLRAEGKLSMEEAASMLNMSSRNLRRHIKRYEKAGLEGLNDRRLGKAAHNIASTDEVLALLALYNNQYLGYNVAHFYDKYKDHHEGQRGYTWVKEQLQKEGLAKKAKKRGAHRRLRPRQAMKGMMLHQDASTHAWIEVCQWDLIVTMDDATSEVYSAFFVEEEGTWSSFKGVQEVIEQHGLFCSLYTDRRPHYWTTPEAGKKVDKENQTQFHRAMSQLGIGMIAAYSPEARGRSERMFGTLQGCLPQELKSAGITTMEGANKFLKEVFLPQLNQRFKVTAQDEQSAFVPWTSHLLLEDILCIQAQRTVSKDNTVSYDGQRWQIPSNKYRYSYAKTKVNIHQYADGSVAIFHGPRKLVHYEPIKKTSKGESCAPQIIRSQDQPVTPYNPEAHQPEGAL